MPYITIQSGELKLYYEEYGLENKDYPPIVVCHGGPGLSDHNLYRRFWTDLPRYGHRVILFDMRGHGLSDDGDCSKWTLSQWADDLFALIQGLKINKPIIAGVSFGGWVAQAYATHPLYGRDLTGLILSNTEAKLDFRSQAEAYKEKALRAGKSVVEADNIAQIIILNNTAPSTEIANRYREHCIPLRSIKTFTPEELGSCRKNMELHNQFYAGEHKFDFTESLKEISCRTLVLAGGEDPEHPIAGVKAMADKIPKVLFKAIAGGAAPVYLDKPDETLSAILEFRKPLKISDYEEDCCLRARL